MTSSINISSRRASLDAQVRHCLGKAATYCLETQDGRGAWQVLPDPRLLETALVGYALLRSPGGETYPILERTRKWVEKTSPQTHHPVALALESGLKKIFLGTDEVIDLLLPEFADTVFSSRAQLLQVIAIHAAVPVKAYLDEAELRRRLAQAFARSKESELKQWSKVELFAMRILLEWRHGQQEAVDETLEQLLAVQSVDGSFFFNPLSTAMAYLALSVAAPQTEAWRRARTSLLEMCQPDDGTWRFCSSDVWDTTLMVRAFRGYRDFDVKALPTATEFLLATQNPDGGWPFRSGVESDSDTTSAALLALGGLSRCTEAIERGLSYLERMQTEDGLWRTWHCKHDPPVEDVVAHVIAALEHYRERHSVLLENARRWLGECFKEKGGWRASWYYGVPYTVLEVGRALNVENPVRRSAVKKLEEIQNTDGSFSPEPEGTGAASSTALAVTSLLDYHTPDNPMISRALEYLVETQGPDGSWVGRPDMYGPRPMLSHYQTHTQAFVAMGLNKARKVMSA